MNKKTRLLAMVLGVLALCGVAAWTAYVFTLRPRVTPEKIAQFVDSLDLVKLNALDRSRAIHGLALQVNSLSLEERRRWRMQADWRKWFNEMTEDERSAFIEATLPTGFKQVITAFEDLPEARRKQAIDDAMKKLRETGKIPVDREPGHSEPAYGTNGPLAMSPELEKKVRALGLKTFYNESSAQTKAEVAPFLEELQHQMQRDRTLH